MIAWPGVQIGQHRIHLVLGHLIPERGHHSLARQQNLFNFCICCRLTIGQCVPAEEAMQIRRNLFQMQIILLVAVSATYVVEVLALSLLRRQLRRRSAPRYTGRNCRSYNRCPGFPKPHSFSLSRKLAFRAKPAATRKNDSPKTTVLRMAKLGSSSRDRGSSAGTRTFSLSGCADPGQAGIRVNWKDSCRVSRTVRSGEQVS